MRRTVRQAQKYVGQRPVFLERGGVQLPVLSIKKWAKNAMVTVERDGKEVEYVLLWSDVTEVPEKRRGRAVRD